MQTLVSSFLGPLTCYLLMPTLVEVVNSQSVLCISWCQFIGYSRKLSSFYLWPSYSGGNEDNGDLLQKIPCVYCYTQCPQPCSRPPLTHTSAGDSWTLLGKFGSVSCGVTASFSWVLVHIRFYLCPPRVYFPVLCKFWHLYGGLNGDLLQEGLCHTQVCCTQSPCPHSSPLLTCTSTGDAKTQFCLSL